MLPRVVRVLGEPSSGTRLVTRVIAASPDLRAWHDRFHGGVEWKAKPRALVLVRRDPLHRLESAYARGLIGVGVPYPELRRAHPEAICVDYEDVVADVHTVIDDLADALGVPSWMFTDEIYDANAERGSRQAVEWDSLIDKATMIFGDEVTRILDR